MTNAMKYKNLQKLPKYNLPLSFTEIMFFAISKRPNSSVLSLCICKSIVWLSLGWVMLERKKFFSRRRVEKVLSAIAVLTGMVSTSQSKMKTSENIALLLGIPLMMSHNALSVVSNSYYRSAMHWRIYCSSPEAPEGECNKSANA